MRQAVRDTWKEQQTTRLQHTLHRFYKSTSKNFSYC